MNSLKNLLDRIDAETSIREERKKRHQQERVDAFETRRRRYRELLQPTVSRLKKLWLPRLQLFAEKFQVLAAKFGASVKATPEIGTGQDIALDDRIVDFMRTCLAIHENAISRRMRSVPLHSKAPSAAWRSA